MFSLARPDVQDIIIDVLKQHGVQDCSAVSGMEVGLSEAGDVGMISYRRPDKDARIRTRVGRWVRKYLGDGLTDVEIEKIGAEITASLWASDDGCVREFRGEAIRWYYLERVSGVPSCMANDYTQDYLDLYADNPDRVSLAYVRLGGHAARALVWTWPDGTRYMDRIYSTSGSVCEAIQLYATRHNIAVGHPKAEPLPMRIRNGKNSMWPFIDTLFLVTVTDEHHCLLSSRDGEFEARSTRGELSPISHCKRCGHQVSSYAIRRSDSGDTYCETCFLRDHDHCDICHGSCSRDHLTLVPDQRFTEFHVCPRCFEFYYSRCDVCGQAVYFTDIQPSHGRSACPQCM